MRRLLAPLSRWLDRRIDARIAAATESLRSSNSLLWSQVDRLARDRDAPFEFAHVAGDVVGPLPAGHVALAEIAVEGIRDTAAVQREGQDAGRHGLSLEWFELGGHAATGGMLDDLPPVGSSFVQVVAAESGSVLVCSGTPLPDNHIRYGTVSRMAPEAARAVAAALVRAADLTSGAPSSDRLLRGGQSGEQIHHLHPERATRGDR